MISLNFKPTLSIPGMMSEIVLTDSAYSKQSVVYMDKNDAPIKGHLAWVNFTVGSDIILSKWMFVEQVMFTEYLDRYTRNSDGTIIVDNENRPILRSLRDTPGYVIVYLREHKHILTKQQIADHMNIPAFIRHVLPVYYDLYPDYHHNHITWEGLSTLLSTFMIEMIFDEDERPPILPMNLLWKGLLLADAIDDLLHSFGGRVIEQTVFTPDAAFFETADFRNLEWLETQNTFTELQWKQRRYFDPPTNINYDKSLFPEETEEYREWQKEVKCFFINFAGTDFSDGNTSFDPAADVNTGTYVTFNYPLAFNDKVIVFNRIEWAPFYGASPPNVYLDEVRHYMRNNAINRELFYHFNTHYLPESFITSHDWSEIRYQVQDNDYRIVVNHEPRNLQGRVITTRVVNRTEVYRARITNVDPSVISIKNIECLSKPLDNLVVRDTITIPNTMILDHTNIGKNIEFQIANNTLTILSTNSLFTTISDTSNVIPLHNGTEVTGITHKIVDLNWACPDSAISFLNDPILDYAYDSHEAFNFDGYSSNEKTYNIARNLSGSSTYAYFEQYDISYVKVRFRLKSTLQDIIDSLQTKEWYTAIGDAYINGVAQYFYNNFSVKDFFFTFSPSPSRIDWLVRTTPFSHTGGGYGPRRFGTYINPDITSKWFIGPRGYVTPTLESFPYTYPIIPNPITQPIFPDGFMIIDNFNNNDLGLRYIRNHLETFAAKVDLIF